MQRYIVSFLFTYYHIVFGVQSFSTLPVLIRRNTIYHLFCKNDIVIDGAGSSSSYSWVNPKLDDTINQFQSNIIQIDFDGCGQIQLHQERDKFIQPIHNKTRAEAGQTGRTGTTLWSAAHVVSNYIDAQFSEGGQWSSSNWTVLELGAGLGLCSTVAAKYGINNIVSTDNDFDVLHLLKENLERNKHSEEQKIHVHSLDWMAAATDSNAEKTHPVFLELEPLGGADLILLSDVIYGATELVWESLLTLLDKFCVQRRRLGNDKDNASIKTQLDRNNDPIVLLGYTQRRRDMSPLDEARFFALVKAFGMEAVLIPSNHIPHSDKYMLTSLFELRWIT